MSKNVNVLRNHDFRYKMNKIKFREIKSTAVIFTAVEAPGCSYFLPCEICTCPISLQWQDHEAIGSTGHLEMEQLFGQGQGQSVLCDSLLQSNENGFPWIQWRVLNTKVTLLKKNFFFLDKPLLCLHQHLTVKIIFTEVPFRRML